MGLRAISSELATQKRKSGENPVFGSGWRHVNDLPESQFSGRPAFLGRPDGANADVCGLMDKLRGLSRVSSAANEAGTAS